MTDRHSRWDSVRVHNQIWDDSFSRKRQIVLSVSHTTSTFLTVPGSKLVSDLWDLDRSHLDFDEQVVVLLFGDHDLIDKPSL